MESRKNMSRAWGIETESVRKNAKSLRRGKIVRKRAKSLSKREIKIGRKKAKSLSGGIRRE